MRAWAWLVLVLVAGCFRPPAAPDAFAVGVVEAARGAALGPEWFDDALADRLRRVQWWKRVPLEHAAPSLVAALYAGDPEGALPPAERGRIHRERAAHNLRVALGGSCRARRDDELARTRLHLLTAPVPNAPPAASAELAALATALRRAVVVRVECERGDVAATLVPEDHWRVVDLFAPASTELTPLPLAAR